MIDLPQWPVLFKSLFEYCKGLIEIRQIKPFPRREFFPIDVYAPSSQKYLNTQIKNWGSRDLYFAVASRDGDGGKKENIVLMPAAFCDVDFSDTPPDRLRENMRKFPFKPSLAVFSGGGWHFYWVLKEPAGPEDIPLVEAVNRKIAAAIGGDMNATDASRVLRIPWTLNSKRGVLATLRHVSDYRFALEDLEDLPAAPAARSIQRPSHGVSGAILQNLLQCGFIRCCYLDQAAVIEPAWYSMLSNVARISPGGISLAHRFSDRHPKYSPQETNRKILHALDAAGPHTCQYIRRQRFRGCDQCGHDSTPLNRALKGDKFHGDQS